MSSASPGAERAAWAILLRRRRSSSEAMVNACERIFIRVACRASFSAGMGKSNRRSTRRPVSLLKKYAVSAMGEVDRHSHLVHALHHVDAEIAQPPVAPVHASGAEAVLAVVVELRHPLSHAVKEIHVVHGAEVIRVLEAEKKPELSRSADSSEVSGGGDPQEPLPVIGEKAVPLRRPV
jgi:hypothetical protein